MSTFVRWMKHSDALVLGGLIAGTALMGCEEVQQPTQPDQQTMNEQQVAANNGQGGANAHDDTPPATRGTPPIFKVSTWGNEHLWQFSAPPNDVLDTGERSHSPFYVIGAVDENSPHSGPAGPFFGTHDHTIPVPPRNHGTYSAIWHIELVEPADGAVSAGDVLVREPDPCQVLCVPGLQPDQLVYAADLNDDGSIGSNEVLDSSAEVEQAAEMGLVDLRDTGIVFKCPVRDIEG